MMNTNEYFKKAIAITDQVGKYLISNFGTTKEMIHKTDTHYGIADDKVANGMYEEYFKKATPQIALYTEEGEQNLNNNLVWVIDPIEGTSNYRSGNPFFATQVALLEENKPILSIVYAPILKLKFTAIKDSGAFLNNKKISVTSTKDLDKALVDIGRGTKDVDKDWYMEMVKMLNKKVRTYRTFGACGLDICFAAAGITDVYINTGSQIYDYLPGALIAKEAGAKVTNFKGKDWNILDNEILITNDILSKEIIKIINND